MTPLLLIAAVATAVAQASPDANWKPGQSWPTAPRTNLPTGVVANRIPDTPGVRAIGATAQAFVSSVFGAQSNDGGKIDDANRPFLVLAGPDDATKQIEDQIPAEIANHIHISRYPPNAPALKNLGIKAGNRGVKAMVLGPDGLVYYDAVFVLDDVLDALRNAIAGGDPDKPNKSPLLPLFPRRRSTMLEFPFFVGFLAGSATVVGLAVVWLSVKAAIQKAVRDLVAEPAQAHAAEPRRPGGPK